MMRLLNALFVLPLFVAACSPHERPEKATPARLDSPRPSDEPTKEGGPDQSPDAKERFERYMKDPKSWVRLGPIPAVKLAAPRMPTQAEADTIRGLIADLANLETPDFGLSPTLTGVSFAPLGKTEFHGGLLTNHQIRASHAMIELVGLGPRALPALLRSLDDQTPTRLEVSHKGGFGGMWHDSELWGNPANTREQEILAENHRPEFGHEEGINSYTVKVGDVCFVAIGQIVGRSYSAVRYQPTACIVLNSPTHTKLLRDLVRKIWEAGEPAQALLNSLLTDFATNGVFNGQSLDGWSVGSAIQSGSAMRLLYYFAEETASLIAQRLDQLNLDASEGIDGFMRREVKNGVRTREFLAAVSWCENPLIHKALSRLRDRAKDPEFIGGLR